MSLTQRRSVGYQDIHAFRNEVPFLEQRLAAWEVKTPAVKPGLPVGEEQGVQSWPPRVGAMRVIEFCQKNALVIANTLFQQHKILHMEIGRAHV